MAARWSDTHPSVVAFHERMAHTGLCRCHACNVGMAAVDKIAGTMTEADSFRRPSELSDRRSAAGFLSPRPGGTHHRSPLDPFAVVFTLVALAVVAGLTLAVAL